MSRTPRFTRARQLTSTVLPGLRPDGRATLGRLRQVAAARGTGMLPFSGRTEGAIYFRDGRVAYAESSRTPGPADHADRAPAAHADPAPAASADPAPAASPAGLPPLSRITAILAITEPTVDAVLELLSARSRCARFRAAGLPAAGLAPGISLDALLAEVARRQRVLAQVSAVVTADTALAPNPHLSPESIRVSAWQRALLIRVSPGSTPRDLAWDLGRSVFCTTAEVYRLLARRLLSVAGDPVPAPGDAAGLPALSFVRAASVRNGETVLPISAGTAPGGAGR